jgi:hypothetical protein
MLWVNEGIGLVSDNTGVLFGIRSREGFSIKLDSSHHSYRELTSTGRYLCILIEKLKVGSKTYMES